MSLHRFVLAAAIAAIPLAVSAQTTSVTQLTAAMSASNENPAVDKQAFGSALISIKATRGESGALTSAVVDFNIQYFVGAPEMITAMHIHRGAAGVNGPVVINSGLAGPIQGDGEGVLFYQAMVTDSAMLAVVQDILDNPWNYYVNAHATTAPGGFIRGQLQLTTLSAIVSSSNQISSLDSKVNAMKATLDRIAGRLGVVPVNVP